MITVVCAYPACGVVFGIPEHVEAQARRLGDKRSVHCPNGHPFIYSEPEAEKLKRRVADLEAQLEGANTRYHTMEEAADRYERRIASLRGRITYLSRVLAAERRARRRA